MSAYRLIAQVAHVAEINESINRIRARHYRETGLRMPLATAYEVHAIEPEPDDIFPDRVALLPAKRLLLSKGYTDVAVAGAISDIARDGTAQSSSWIDAEDRDEVEAAIPGNPWQWGPDADADCWETDSII